MPRFNIDIQHNGQSIDCNVIWDGGGGSYFTGISGLFFSVLSIDGRETTPEERERLDEELIERYDSQKDTEFFDRIATAINEHGTPD